MGWLASWWAGRTGRRPRGRHAASRAPRPPASTPAPAPARAIAPGRAPGRETGRDTGPQAPPAPAVGLVFADGSSVLLDPADPRVRAFRAVAGELVRVG